MKVRDFWPVLGAGIAFTATLLLTDTSDEPPAAPDAYEVNYEGTVCVVVEGAGVDCNWDAP